MKNAKFNVTGMSCAATHFRKNCHRHFKQNFTAFYAAERKKRNVQKRSASHIIVLKYAEGLILRPLQNRCQPDQQDP